MSVANVFNCQFRLSHISRLLCRKFEIEKNEVDTGSHGNTYGLCLLYYSDLTVIIYGNFAEMIKMVNITKNVGSVSRVHCSSSP